MKTANPPQPKHKHTVAPRCPGPHSTGFFVVPDESLRILNFFAPKPDLPSRIIRCSRF
ncbi:hypothetical protein L873DRAFT_1797297 [Choiromyces venosus 120613-1]|uniref:Uncharacterized protein n=1 Tax=Choiromyces venosus 120613-1 TaxID=1336337 RepID=A0A3N4K4Y1_9PEZI|nr:hypothetical protein L873DRAFT_1797297 [Choiromyces venosus 120613-1]